MKSWKLLPWEGQRMDLLLKSARFCCYFLVCILHFRDAVCEYPKTPYRQELRSQTKGYTQLRTFVCYKTHDHSKVESWLGSLGAKFREMEQDKEFNCVKTLLFYFTHMDFPCKAKGLLEYLKSSTQLNPFLDSTQTAQQLAVLCLWRAVTLSFESQFVHP